MGYTGFMLDETRRAMVWLGMVTGLGPVLTGRLLEKFGGAAEAVNASAGEIAKVEGIGSKSAREIRRQLDEADLEGEIALIERHGVSIVTIEDEGYPALLKNIYDPPPVLYVKGELRRTDNVALAMVGSRQCTAYGREQASRLAGACASAGLTIVSGGARGIDSAAHRAALQAGGRTIAVLGCGLANVYPPENGGLFEEIAGTGPAEAGTARENTRGDAGTAKAGPGSRSEPAIESRGAVVSELPMRSPPMAENFPRRNRLISGLSLGVVVVEAALRSGALITARLAAEEHHREVMAVPGRVDSPASAGCHKIIREGWATLVSNAADILDALGETGQILRGALPEMGKDEPVAAVTLNDEQRKLLEAIDVEPTDLDSVARKSGLAIHIVNSQLTMLQLRGLVERVGGSQVRRRK